VEEILTEFKLSDLVDSCRSCLSGWVVGSPPLGDVGGQPSKSSEADLPFKIVRDKFYLFLSFLRCVGGDIRFY